MATQTRNPTSDEAVSGTWTGAPGVRYTLVDDHPDSGGADDLNHGTTAGNITFGFSAFSIPAGSTGISVAILYYDKDASNGNNNAAGRLKVNGVYYVSSTHNPGSTYTLRTDTWATNPNTSAAWTVADVNGTGSNPLQAFGWNSTDASPAINFSSIQLEVTYTPPSNRGQVSFAEIEVPMAPRRGRVSFGEFETPSSPRRMLVTWGETEVSTAPRRGRVSFGEIETPIAPRRLLTAWAEIESPIAPRRGWVSFGEFEVPSLSADRRLVTSFAEIEAPFGPRRLITGWAELEIPDAARRGLVAYAEIETPFGPRRVRIPWAELETPNADRRLVQSWAELEVPFAPRRLLVSWSEIQTPGGPAIVLKARMLRGIGR